MDRIHFTVRRAVLGAGRRFYQSPLGLLALGLALQLNYTAAPAATRYVDQ